jgi:hypothetical protein
MRILNAYDSGFHYGTKTFKDIKVISRWWISRNGRHIICYVSIVSFVVDVIAVDKLKL